MCNKKNEYFTENITKENLIDTKINNLNDLNDLNDLINEFNENDLIKIQNKKTANDLYNYLELNYMKYGKNNKISYFFYIENHGKYKSSFIEKINELKNNMCKEIPRSKVMLLDTGRESIKREIYFNKYDSY